jgi:hypothetical protein
LQQSRQPELAEGLIEVGMIHVQFLLCYWFR